MSNHVKVSVPNMKRDGERLHTGAEQIPKFVRELEGAMRSLGTCWEGPAWIAFQQQVESDILNMLDVYDWMRRYLQALSDAEKVYGSCEEQSYECVERVRV